MKLVIIIPCFNEEKTLDLVVNSIPNKIEGISKIEIVIIDDGSTDKTIDVAKKLGVNYIISNTLNKGLARSFEIGLNKALSLDADIIVNTDGDNQYPQQNIPDLIKPILENKADIVVANRQTNKIKHFSFIKKLFQFLGSSVVRYLSGVQIPDAVSGFRAYSRDAAKQLNIVTEFSYAIETLIQAGKKKLSVKSIDIQTNSKTRESRLFKNMWQHIKRSGSTIVRVFAMYEPFKTFFFISNLFFAPGFLLGLRFIYFYLLEGSTSGHIQSLILMAVLLIVGFQVFLIGLLADLIANNRKLIEKILRDRK
ncbi:MAG: glycosyl transferase [Candidatus Pacebacteria bacterium CG2_30_36_39]|nr:MAG: glycosyl transferase [Candidatus Pacebacteria bacterium CG2_30_36_39]